jgi:hypothetical protein
MSNWIFLTKDGSDEYINMFARGCGTVATPIDNFNFNDSNAPIVLRGILKHKIMKQCWDSNRSFYYIDTGYFGNERTKINPNGWKYWHRIVKNNLQHGEIIPRPSDRFEKFKKPIHPWKKDGRKILIASPDEKPCKFYGIDKQEWLDQTINLIKNYTDRPVEIRERSPNRIDRIKNSTLQQALDNDVFALVTFNSNAATEANFYGIPTFTLAPCNAASPISLQDLSKIETPYYPDEDIRFAWACHLAYGQFHVTEMKDGTAKRMLEQ